MKGYGPASVVVWRLQRLAVIACVWLFAGAGPGAGRQVMAEASADWRNLPAAQLTQFYSEQQKHNFAEVTRDELLDHAWSAYLNNRDYLSATDPAEWVALAKDVAPALDDTRKQQLIETTETVLFREDKLKLMSVWTVWRLRSMGSGLDVPQEKVYEWTRDWLVAADNWKQDAGHGEINMLLDWTVTVRNQAGYDMTAVLDDIYGYIRDKALNDPQWLNETGSGGMLKMLRRIADKVTPEQRDRVRANLVQLVTGDREAYLKLSIADLSQFLEMAERYGAEKPQRDRLAVDWLAHSQAWKESDQWYMESLSTLFDTPEQRRYLTGMLIDEAGRPRQHVGRVLSRMYVKTDDLPHWLSLIEDQIEASAEDRDRQTTWMLVRAEAESARHGNGGPEEAVQWAVRGIEAAETDEARLACLEWIVNEYSRLGREGEAAAMIREQSVHFEGEAFRDQLASLEKMMAVSER